MANITAFNSLSKGWKVALTGGTPAHIVIDPGVTYNICFTASALAEVHMLFNTVGDTPNAAALTPNATGKAGIFTMTTDKVGYAIAPSVGGQLSVVLIGGGTATIYLSRVEPSSN